MKQLPLCPRGVQRRPLASPHLSAARQTLSLFPLRRTGSHREHVLGPHTPRRRARRALSDSLLLVARRPSRRALRHPDSRAHEPPEVSLAPLFPDTARPARRMASRANRAHSFGNIGDEKRKGGEGQEKGKGGRNGRSSVPTPATTQVHNTLPQSLPASRSPDLVAIPRLHRLHSLQYDSRRALAHRSAERGFDRELSKRKSKRKEKRNPSKSELQTMNRPSKAI